MSFLRLRKSLRFPACVMAFAIASFASAARQDLPRPSLDHGFQQMYNLDFSSAHATFLAYQQAHPQDPMGFVSNAAAYLFSGFDRLHILEADLFTDDHKFENRGKLTPDPALKTEFEKELSRSDERANQALRKSPQDKNALFAQVLTNGLRGDYTAMIEKRNLASLGYMKTSRAIAQKLLTLDPTSTTRIWRLVSRIIFWESTPPQCAGSRS